MTAPVPVHPEFAALTPAEARAIYSCCSERVQRLVDLLFITGAQSVHYKMLPLDSLFVIALEAGTHGGRDPR